MSLKSIKRRIKDNSFGAYLVNIRKKAVYNRYLKKYTDEEFVKKLYYEKMGVYPDLKEPKRFTEKLQWLKLHYRDADIPICSNKVDAKEYVASHGYPELIIPNLAVYDNADELDLDSLPEKFIVKASHGSGWNFICKDKKNVNWKMMKKVMNVWLKENLYVYGREWNYKEQMPMLLVEPLLDDKPLVDYKFMCFNGVCRAMQVNHDVDGTHYVDFYDSDWVKIDSMSCGVYPCSDAVLPKPERFDEMKAIAQTLAKPFPFVRVDLYYVNGSIYFGEMTYFPGSGLWEVKPDKFDFELGSWLSLPASNHNQDI